MSTTDASTPEIVDVEPATTAVVRDVVPMDEMAAFFDRSFTTLAEVVGRQGVAITGPAFAAYHGPPTATADLEAGFPTQQAIEPDGDVVAGSLPGGRVARLVHEGGYDGLGPSWGRLAAWIAEQGATPGPLLWEVYVTEPNPEMDPADLRTELYWLLAD